MALGIGAVGGSAVSAFNQADATRLSALSAAENPKVCLRIHPLTVLQASGRALGFDIGKAQSAAWCLTRLPSSSLHHYLCTADMHTGRHTVMITVKSDRC